MEKIIARHKAEGDNGKTYSVLEFQNFVNADGHDGPSQIPGLKRLALSDGESLNRIDAKTFEIVATGEIIRKTD